MVPLGRPLPAGSPLPALGSPRKVTTVNPCENRLALTGGNKRDVSQVISFDWKLQNNQHHVTGHSPFFIEFWKEIHGEFQSNQLESLFILMKDKIKVTLLTGLMSCLLGGGGGLAQSRYSMRSLWHWVFTTGYLSPGNNAMNFTSLTIWLCSPIET